MGFCIRLHLWRYGIDIYLKVYRYFSFIDRVTIYCTHSPVGLELYALNREIADLEEGDRIDVLTLNSESYIEEIPDVGTFNVGVLSPYH